VDFVRYADFAAALVNSPMRGGSDVAAYLASRPWMLRHATERDATALRRLGRELRPVFEASDRGDEATVVALVNGLLARHPVTPFIAGHDSQSWHLHVAESSSLAARITGECVMGLAMLIVDYGATRLGVCTAVRCDNVFVDTSPNKSRRYCSERCSSRANVAAYRARRKAGAHL
jgi:CGNR zinc finger/Putative stress-induced transcription regulator